jgi:hypothetical protein
MNEEICIELSYDEYEELARYTSSHKPWVFLEVDSIKGNIIKKINLYIKPKSTKNRYLIKVNDQMFIDNLVLVGDYDELIEKMQRLDFVTSLGIHESFYFEQFELIPEDTVDFPEYKI